jgi:hypothetical protein
MSNFNKKTSSNCTQPKTPAGPTRRQKSPSNRQPENSDAAVRKASKGDQVVELLKRPQGATLDEIVNATSWQRHTARAALTGLRKKGNVINSEKQNGVRRYRIAASA